MPLILLPFILSTAITGNNFKPDDCAACYTAIAGLSSRVLDDLGNNKMTIVQTKDAMCYLEFETKDADKSGKQYKFSVPCSCSCKRIYNK